MIKAKIGYGASITYEEFCYFSSRSSVIAPIRIGAYSYVGELSIIGSVRIGRFCSIAPRVTIGLGEHDMSYFSTHPFFFASKNGFNIPNGIGVPRNMDLPRFNPPIIHHDVWIGANALVLRGVTIGTGAVIAGGAVVNRDVKPYEIVGGVPIRHLGWRFPAEIIDKLLQSNWWDYDICNFVGLDSSNPDKFLEQFQQIKDKKIAVYNMKYIGSN